MVFGKATVEAKVVATINGQRVELDNDDIANIFNAVFHHRLVSFHVSMPESETVVTNHHKLTDWAWLEVLATNALCIEYEDGLSIELDLKDTLDGGLKEKPAAAKKKEK
jgi:hypothetical protein